jgi:hypothetical protein
MINSDFPDFVFFQVAGMEDREHSFSVSMLEEAS